MRLLPTTWPDKLEDLFVTRTQVVFMILVTFCGSFLFLLPDFPFAPEFSVIAVISCLFHVLMIIFFKSLTPIHFNIANLFNLIMLGSAVYFSGGILSPFTMIFVLILISGAGYGVNYPLALTCAVGTYVAVITLEYFGVLPPIDISHLALYRSWPTAIIVIVSNVGFMVISGAIYEMTVQNLSRKLDREHSLRNSMIKQLSKLEAPSQIGLLVNKIVHDIRGPLGAIAGFVKTIQSENKLTVDSEEDCAVMLTELNRINNLMNRMVNYVRPGQASKQIICPVDLVETVLSVVSFYPEAKRVKFGKTFPEAGSLMIHANKEELQQVIFNILKNSLEALEKKERPCVNVGIYVSGPDVFIVIRDNGPGVPQQTAGKLTHEIFSTKKDGAGVGLIIAKEIVEMHQGSMEFQSQEGEGTSVAIRLPRRSERLEKAVDREVLEKTNT